MKKLIAEALYDLAKKSTTTFIEISKDDKELIEAAKKLGIVLPSPDLAIMKTVYCEIDKPNRNGVQLSRKAVEEGIPTLIGKQVNWEHLSAGYICGYTLDAQINEDKVETINVIFKSLFPEEMDKVKEKFDNKELAVSFEIWNRNEKGESVVKELENGIREIAPIIFHGTGLLLDSQPACPNAKTYKLLASEKKIFEEDLVYAALARDEQNCTKQCDNCTCKGGEKMEEVLENSDKIAEAQKPEEVIQVAKAEDKKEKLVEAKKEETTEACGEVVCKKVVETKDENKGVRIRTVKFDDGTEEIQKEEYNMTNLFSQAQLDEKITEAKKELEAKIVEKDTELAALKAEKEAEVQKITAELEKKTQEIDKIKIESAKETKELDLSVGNVEDKKDVEDKYNELRKKINKRAFKSTKKEEEK